MDRDNAECAPVVKVKLPNLASQSRVRLQHGFNTGLRSPGELEMTSSTSEVAVCCPKTL